MFVMNATTGQMTVWVVGGGLGGPRKRAIQIFHLYLLRNSTFFF